MNLNKLIVILMVLLSPFFFIIGTIGAKESNVSKPLAPVAVNVSVDRSEITIGDKVRLTISVEHDDGLKVTFPEFGEKLADFTIKDYGVTEPKSLKTGRIVQKEWYVLDTFLTGSYVIPPLTVKYETANGETKEIESKEIFVEVKSVIGEGDTAEDIRGIRGPVNIAVNYSIIYIIIGGVIGTLAIIGGLVYFFKTRKVVKQEVVPPPLPAHEIAYRELRDLAELDLIPKGRIKEYYYRLSNIVRCYIENRFALMAPERTTEEFLSEIVDVQVLEMEHKCLIRRFLEQCDLVKFAKYGPDGEEIDKAYNAAKKLVDETKNDEQLASSNQQ